MIKNIIDMENFKVCMKVIGCKSTTSQGDHDVTNFCWLLFRSLLHYQDKIHIYIYIKIVFKTFER